MTLPFVASKVIITGYSGFTGIYLARELRAKGYEVHGIIRSAPQSEWEHQIDLGDKTALVNLFKKIQPDYFIHLAAVSFVVHECVADFYNINLLGTLHLLEAIHAAGLQPRKILISSSANVYGNPGDLILNESIQPLPMNHYANSKLAMENMVRLWFDRFPILITRPFNYTGPGQTKNFLIPKIVAHFKEKKSVINLGNLDVVRDVTDIDFVVECYIRLLEHEVHSEIINICSGIGYSIEDVLHMMSTISGYKIRVEVDSSLVRSNEIKQLIGCNKKLSTLIGELKNQHLPDTLVRMYAD